MSIEPVRSCIGCRTRRPVSALVRITRGADGLAIDGPSAGRGAWLCRTARGVSEACLAQAIARGAFARAWRADVEADELAPIRSARVGTSDASAPADRG